MADTLTFQSGITGRAASLGYQFVDTAGAAIGSRITSGIAEIFANVGDYIVTGVTIPSNAVAVYWDDSGNADNHALEQLLLPSKALTNITAWTVAITGNITGNLSGSVGSVTGLTASDVGTIKTKTDQLTFTVANQVDSNALSGGGGLDAAGVRGAIGMASANLDTQLNALPTAVENADALLDRNMATGTDSGSATVRTPRQAFRALRNKFAVVPTSATEGTYKVAKEDDDLGTPSWESVVTLAAGASPVTASDPAGP